MRPTQERRIPGSAETGLSIGIVSPRLLPPSRADAGTGPGAHPDFVYHGGRVIETPQVHVVFVGDWTSATHRERARRLTQFTGDFLASTYMNILSQYGCGSSGTVAAPVFLRNPTRDLSEADIQNLVQGAIDNEAVPEPSDPSIAYLLFLDDSLGVDDGDVVMCEATSDTAFGFHYFFTTAAGNSCAFAVVPGLTDECLRRSCPDDARCSLHLALTQEQRQTQVASHELSEMFSDPELDAWTSPTVGENGDICNGRSGTITAGANTWTVQLMYSKWHDLRTNGATTCLAGNPEPLASLLAEPVVQGHTGG